MLPQAVSEHYAAQQRLIVGTLGLTRREWSAMSMSDLDGSWAKVSPRVNLLTASAQLGSARNGAGYVAATLAEFGEDLTPAAFVDPRAFAGIASDGRSLSTLLDGALYRAKGANSLEAGGKWLDMAVHTQIADAGRSAASVAIASYDDVGWVRMVNPPCCGPCAVLSGKKFRYNQGFQRHPRCDCVHIPSTLANPADNMGANPSLDQITDLTDGERKALEEGADLPQVINARRRRGRDKMSTLEGAGRGGARRLTPDGIFAQAKDRDEALALLRKHGYLGDYARTVPATRAPVRAASSPKFDPKWREGRDVHIAKLKDAERHKAMVESFSSSIARLERDKAYFLEQIEARRKFILNEGLTGRQAAAIMKKQPDVIAWRSAVSGLDDNIASLQRQIDDVAERLARTNLPDFDPDNPLKFYGDRYTFHDESDISIRWAQDWETFDEDLHRLMRDHFAEVDGSGVFVGGDRNLTDVDDLQRLKNVRASMDRHYDEVGGLYSPTSRVCGCSNHAWFNETHSTALHEAGHVIDDALGRVSASSEWTAAHESIPVRSWLNPYYQESANSQYLSESWAESLASYHRGKIEGLSGDDLAEFVGRAMGVNPQSTINGENAAILTGRPLVEAVTTLLKRVGR